MTWKPTTCQILERKLLNPQEDTPIQKWEMIQKHNDKHQTPGSKNKQTMPYLTLLQQKYIQADTKNYQITIYNEQIKPQNTNTTPKNPNPR